MKPLQHTRYLRNGNTGSFAATVVHAGANLAAAAIVAFIAVAGVSLADTGVLEASHVAVGNATYPLPSSWHSNGQLVAL